MSVSVSIAYKSLRRLNIFTPPPQDVEDLAQVAAETLWRLRDREPGYAYGAAIRECVKYYTRVIIGRNPLSAKEYDDDIATEDTDALAELDIDPDELASLLLSHRQKRGRRGLAISKREAALVLLVLRGYSNREIAAEMDLTVKTVKTYRRRIRARLQEFIARRGA